MNCERMHFDSGLLLGVWNAYLMEWDAEIVNIYKRNSSYLQTGIHRLINSAAVTQKEDTIISLPINSKQTYRTNKYLLQMYLSI